MDTPTAIVTSAFLLEQQASWNIGLTLHGVDQVAGLPAKERAHIQVIVTSGDFLDPTLLDQLPNLKLVACFSTGYSGIDLVALRARRIALTTAAGVNAHDVADHALALLLSWWHDIPRMDSAVRAGAWHPNFVPRRSLQGRRAGIVGFGRIGQKIAERAAALGLLVSWWGPREHQGSRYPRVNTLVELAQASEILFVSMRATPAEAGQIDARVLQALGKNGVLVNVSRGFVVVEDALIEALARGTIAGAALDVFSHEPPDPERWRGLGNVILSPHVGGFTQEAAVSMFGQLAENLRRHFAGQPLLTPVVDAS